MITSTVTESLAVWVRSSDFNVSMSIYDPAGSLLATDGVSGRLLPGDISSAAVNVPLVQSGTYQIQLSSSTGVHAAGRFSMSISPGINNLMTWGGRYKTDVFYVSSSGCIGVSENSWGAGAPTPSLLLWNISSSAIQMVNYDWPYVNGSFYSEAQDRIFESVTDLDFLNWMVEYDNTGSVIVSHSLSVDFWGYATAYDRVNDRFFTHVGAWWNIWDCASRTALASGSDLTDFANDAVGCTYSDVNNRYYVAWENASNNTRMSYIDAATFAPGTTANALCHNNIVYEPVTQKIFAISSAGAVIIDPLTDTVVSTISSGVLESVAYDPCTGKVVVAVDDAPPGNLIVLDPSASWATSNYILRSKDSTEYFYGMCHAELDSRMYMTTDTYTTNSSSLWNCKITFPTASILFGPPPALTDLTVFSSSIGCNVNVILNWNSSSNDQDFFVIQRSSDGIVYADYDNILPVFVDLVTNGGFETGDKTGWTLVGNPTNTYVEGGLPEYIHTGLYGLAFGPVGTVDSMSQDLTTGAGNQYFISFWLNTSIDGGGGTLFQLYWEGNLIADLTAYDNLPYTQYSASVTATGPTSKLLFGARNTATYYGLDDVSVIGSNAPLTKSYTDTNVSGAASPGNTYWYQVAAVNAYGTSSFSNTASISLIPPCGGLIPCNLTQLTWSVISQNGNVVGGFTGSRGDFIFSSSYLGAGNPMSDIQIATEFCNPTSGSTFTAEIDYAWWFDPAGAPNNYYVVNCFVNGIRGILFNYGQYPTWPTQSISGTVYHAALERPEDPGSSSYVSIFPLFVGANSVTYSIYQNASSSESNFTCSLYVERT